MKTTEQDVEYTKSSILIVPRNRLILILLSFISRNRRYFRFLSDIFKYIFTIEEGFLEDFDNKASGMHDLLAVPVVIFLITNERESF